MKQNNESTSELTKRLEEKRTAHRDAIKAVQSAQDVLDADGSASAGQAVLQARESERLAAEMVASAERRLNAARERDAAEERANLERRATEINAELADKTKERELEQREVVALVAAADARVARRDFNDQRENLRSELERIRQALGFPPRSVYATGGGIEPSHVPIREALEALTAGLPTADPRGRYLRELVS
jgi:hypothetical protein